ncbi:hypothetical protein SAMN05216207_102285 [Pseudonocardia ammonioxydans]|uniref:Uncharacterized protein n=1 Tax=Pseudonocardia ammonioxydans TaxID=260086 RepID=A0A1I5CA61_PSUAM|nr:hypothetical protein [Pseudonocardia ammonioxydans]SFN83754.1 hypothetical protein SAMN05216207_102285 [Pseudonocardia ammonioxydans]
MTGLSTRGLWVVVAVMAVVLVGAVWAAGSGPASGPPAATGSVRLGPDPGQDVAGYLAGLPGSLPPPGPAVPALVQFDRPLDAAGAAAAAGPAGAGVETAVFRVPLDRVQTALRFEPVTGTGEVTGALGVARERALFGAEADAGRAQQAAAGATAPEARAALTRRAAVAAAERRALADPGCACVIALVVRADRAGLEALAGRDGVRAVQAAPPGTTAQELALSPLLPQQRTTALPPPDDGPVPTG